AAGRLADRGDRRLLRQLRRVARARGLARVRAAAPRRPRPPGGAPRRTPPAPRAGGEGRRRHRLRRDPAWIGAPGIRDRAPRFCCGGTWSPEGFKTRARQVLRKTPPPARSVLHLGRT